MVKERMFSQEEASSHLEEMVRRKIAWIWGMVPASTPPEGPPTLLGPATSLTMDLPLEAPPVGDTP